MPILWDGWIHKEKQAPLFLPLKNRGVPTTNLAFKFAYQLAGSKKPDGMDSLVSPF